MTQINSILVPGGPIPMVFFHGLFGQGKNWLTIAKRLTDIGTSLLLDAPNHGRSAWSDRFDYPTMAEALYKEIRSHHQFRAGFVLIGHSMGGKTAMRLALSHPEAVKLLVVVDISPVAGHVGKEFPSLIKAMQNLRLDAITDRGSADRQLTAEIPNDTIRSFLLQNLYRKPGQSPAWGWRMNLKLLGNSLDEIGQWSTTKEVYPGPVLWLAGERSFYISPEHLPIMKTHFPRTILVNIKNAGHWIHTDQPAAFESALRTFLQLNYRPD